MASIRVVPWYNAEQFRKVYEYLYSNELTKKRWALDTISVWQTRCHPSLPTAIEATYVLTSAVVQDILWNVIQSSLIHYTDLQGIYGSAVTRFVSLCVEVNKKDGLNKYSIAEVAKSIGIESFIVDIRNEWCHSSRPSLDLLRKAAQSALEHLRVSYWEKEAASVNDYIKLPIDDTTELIGLFKEFMEFYDDTIEPPRNIKNDDDPSQYNPEYLTILRRLEKWLKMNKRLFVKVLISNGIFIPFDDEFGQMLTASELTRFNDSQGDDDEDSDIDDGVDKFEFPDVPKYHERLWEEIIALLNKYDAIPLFMEELLKTQGDRTVYGQKLLIAWILTILRIHNCAEKNLPSLSCRLKRLFRHKGILPNWLRMFHSAVVNPCKYFLVIMPLLTSNLDMDSSTITSITGLACLKLGMTRRMNINYRIPKLFRTAGDLKRAMAEKDKQSKKGSTEQSTESVWTRCQDECYKLWPVGHIVNPVKVEDDHQKDEDDDDEFFNLSKGSPVADDDLIERRLYCNISNDDDEDDDDDDEDDDQTCNMEEREADIIKEIIRRPNVLLVNIRS